MASISLFEASLSLFCFLIIFCYFLNKKHFGYLVNKRSPRNWPVLEMLPALVLWSRRIDVLIRVLEKSNLTLLFKGPWFARMDALITVGPANIHHILSSNFSNYIKGPEFKEIVDVFGDPLFTADGDLWKNIRMSSQVILSRQGFQNIIRSANASMSVDFPDPLAPRKAIHLSFFGFAGDTIEEHLGVHLHIITIGAPATGKWVNFFLICKSSL
ncbi:unnamed protein product [Brassica oleracea]|nr:unnamed protein product [Brassica napus]